jgi:elongation factor G
VLCGSAFKNKGVQLLLDAVIAYLPSPADIKPDVVGDRPRRRRPKSSSASTRRVRAFAALAFKVMRDPRGVDKLTYIRIYSGVLKAGSLRSERHQGQHERIGRIYS